MNDDLGHEGGDVVLAQAAQRMLRATRESDTVARAGADELVIVLPDVADIDDVLRVAKALLATLSVLI